MADALVFSLSDQPFQAGTNAYSGLVKLAGTHTNDVGRLRPIYKALRVKPTSNSCGSTNPALCSVDRGGDVQFDFASELFLCNLP